MQHTPAQKQPDASRRAQSAPAERGAMANRLADRAVPNIRGFRGASIPAYPGGGVLQRKCACGGSAKSAGDCAECAEKRDATLQRSATQHAVPGIAPPIVHDVLRSPGRPLDPATRAFMEPRFGHDFGGVRVHSDARAAASARSIDARAYTVGRDVVFGAGQYATGTAEGRSLLAHELAHVVQQGMGAAGLDTKLAVNEPGDAYEQEADRVAALVSGETSPAPARVPAFALMREVAPRRLLQRADCAIKHVEDECSNAASSCKTVEDYCKTNYPKSSDIDAMIGKGKAKAKALAEKAPNAAANMLHFLGNSGTEKVMPTAIFESHAGTKKGLLKHRDKFLEGAKKRLAAGTLAAGALSEQMAWTDTTTAFDFLKQDDLGYAVGGYTLCSKVRVRAKSLGSGKYEVSFEEWTVQAFDCYNWDPGKGVGIPGAADNDMCCIENAGKAQHFRIRTDEWKNSDAASMKAGEVTVPASPVPKSQGNLPILPTSPASPDK